jgi:hypothetical protein
MATTFAASKPGAGSFTGLRPVRVASTALPCAAGRVAQSGYRPLKVVAVDYPRPEIDNTTNFLEAAALSAYMRDAARPERPLRVVIAGAGKSPSASVVWWRGMNRHFAMSLLRKNSSTLPINHSLSNCFGADIRFLFNCAQRYFSWLPSVLEDFFTFSEFSLGVSFRRSGWAQYRQVYR